MRRWWRICAVLSLTAGVCAAQEIRVPAAAVAGVEASISTTGSGHATFYLVGPGVSRKSEVSRGEEIRLQADELKDAGNYLAIICADTCSSASFYVAAAKPASLTFLVHPSRVPVGQGDAVSGVAIPFDSFRNMVLAPVAVNFQLSEKGGAPVSYPAHMQNGVAWFRSASGKSAGALQVTAALDDISARRVVQAVASDPCNLRINGQRTAAGIVVQTDPVRDCAGNPVPDGTIVTFTATGANGKSTVDAPVKQGVARAQIATADAEVISGASGIVLGNEVRVGAKP